MKEIVDAIARVNSIVDEISAATIEQSTGIDRVGLSGSAYPGRPIRVDLSGSIYPYEPFEQVFAIPGD
jgi:hypothetical protein